jgi:hypothetical protein
MRPTIRFIINGITTQGEHKYFALAKNGKFIPWQFFESPFFASTHQFKSMKTAEDYISNYIANNHALLRNFIKADIESVCIQKFVFKDHVTIPLNNPPETINVDRDTKGSFIIFISDVGKLYVLTHTQKSSAATRVDFTNGNSIFQSDAMQFENLGHAADSIMENIIGDNFINPNGRERKVIISKLTIKQELQRQILINML